MFIPGSREFREGSWGFTPGSREFREGSLVFIPGSIVFIPGFVGVHPRVVGAQRRLVGVPRTLGGVRARLDGGHPRLGGVGAGLMVFHRKPGGPGQRAGQCSRALGWGARGVASWWSASATTQRPCRIPEPLAPSIWNSGRKTDFRFFAVSVWRNTAFDCPHSSLGRQRKPMM